METLDQKFSTNLVVTNSHGSVKTGEGNVHVAVYNPQPTDRHRLTLEILSEDGTSLPYMKLEDEVTRSKSYREKVVVRLAIPWVALKALKAVRIELVVQTPGGARGSRQQRLVLDAYNVDLENHRVKMV